MDGIIDVNTMFGPMPSAASDLSVDELGALMQKHSLLACCTLSTIGVLLDHHAGNAATRAACAENPSLLPVATFNPQTFFGPEETVERLRQEGFKMVRFFPGLQGWKVDYAPFMALTNILETRPIPLMVDITLPGMATRLVRTIGHLPGPLILAGIGEQTLAEAIALMRINAHVYLETSELLSTGAITHVVECVGAERVLFGSGAPTRPVASGLAVLEHAGLTDSQRIHILVENARRLLGI
jgi:predicted TIM-barrel fold metal-dependent hydrolase